MVNLGH
jgi:hypothetical protein